MARRIVARNVLRLIKLWLQAPVKERDGNGIPRMAGGKGSKRGTPQVGVASPLLFVICMNRFLKHWRLSGRSGAFRAHKSTPLLWQPRKAVMVTMASFASGPPGEIA